MSQRITRPEVITDLMEDRGINQTRVSVETGIIGPKLSRSLHGHRDLPLRELIAIAKALGVEWCTLLPALGVADPTATDAPKGEPAEWRIAALAERLERVEEIVRAIGNIVVDSPIKVGRK